MIRLLTIEDYDAVFELWKRTKGMGLRSLDDSYDGIKKFIQRNPETNFICEKNNKIVAVILCGHDGRRAYIYHAVVDNDFRKQGIGKLLVDKVVDSLKNIGIHKVALVVFEDNIVGNGFWKSIGFNRRNDLIYRDLSIDKQNV